MQNLEKSMISKLIETAMELIHPIQILRLVHHYLQKTDRFIQGVTLKMQHIHLRTVQNELQFSKQ